MNLINLTGKIFHGCMAEERTMVVGSQKSASEVFTEFAAALTVDQVAPQSKITINNALLDFAGLSISAKDEEYIGAIKAGWDGEGSCTAFGHSKAYDAAGAAVINGTACHGEDYDDTFEGNPMHCTTVIMPAVLAACERYGRSGPDALKGVAIGMELMCRLALVAPTGMHRAGFHPTAITGALAATAGVSVALGLNAKQMTDALGVAGSMASGIIEYLAEGTWTKRLHPGWAAQCGIRAALMGQHGFAGPRTVLEGDHGLFFAFADHEIDRDFSHVTDGLGDKWWMENIAVKPYACGTMTQPFIDCAIRLAKEGLDHRNIDHIECNVGEGTVHRLWEVEKEKQRPTTPYSAKFSGQFCVAVGLVDQAAGLVQFTEEKISDPDILTVARKIKYVIDPNDEYPRNYSGHIRATLKDGSVREAHQPHLRGGVREPVNRVELETKFRANIAYAGWASSDADRLEKVCTNLFDAPNMDSLKEFRVKA
jgi:2-methylcitrate dehydratase PrpD